MKSDPLVTFDEQLCAVGMPASGATAETAAPTPKAKPAKKKKRARWDYCEDVIVSTTKASKFDDSEVKFR